MYCRRNQVDFNENETDTPNANKGPDQNNKVIPKSFLLVRDEEAAISKRMVDNNIYGCIVFWRQNQFNLRWS